MILLMGGLRSYKTTKMMCCSMHQLQMSNLFDSRNCLFQQRYHQLYTILSLSAGQMSTLKSILLFPQKYQSLAHRTLRFFTNEILIQDPNRLSFTEAFRSKLNS